MLKLGALDIEFKVWQNQVIKHPKTLGHISGSVHSSKRLWLKTGFEGFAAMAIRMAESGPNLMAAHGEKSALKQTVQLRSRHGKACLCSLSQEAARNSKCIEMPGMQVGEICEIPTTWNHQWHGTCCFRKANIFATVLPVAWTATDHKAVCVSCWKVIPRNAGWQLLVDQRPQDLMRYSFMGIPCDECVESLNIPSIQSEAVILRPQEMWNHCLACSNNLQYGLHHLKQRPLHRPQHSNSCHGHPTMGKQNARLSMHIISGSQDQTPGHTEVPPVPATKFHQDLFKHETFDVDSWWATPSTSETPFQIMLGLVSVGEAFSKMSFSTEVQSINPTKGQKLASQILSNHLAALCSARLNWSFSSQAPSLPLISSISLVTEAEVLEHPLARPHRWHLVGAPHAGHLGKVEMARDSLWRTDSRISSRRQDSSGDPGMQLFQRLPLQADLDCFHLSLEWSTLIGLVIGSSYIQNDSPTSSFAPLTMVPWAPPHHSSAPGHGSLHPSLLSPTLVFRRATSTNHSQSLSKLFSKATATRQPTGPLLQTKPQHHGGIQRPLLLVDFQGHQKSCHHIVMGCQKCDLVTRIGKVVHHFLTEAKAICPAYRVALDTNVRFGLH